VSRDILFNITLRVQTLIVVVGVARTVFYSLHAMASRTEQAPLKELFMADFSCALWRISGCELKNHDKIQLP
jgi:hypothetical protein